MDDLELLKEWADRGSDEAFRSLVERHVNLVYSVARRSVPTSHQAEEITQTVFIILARKARNLSSQTILAGWLYRTARYAAAQMLRAESRRQHHHTLATMDNPPPDAVWEQIAPHLETALDQLKQTDRDALLLRFMEEKSFREVGHALGLNEDAARKKVDRALEKLRSLFARKGVTTPAALLGTALAAHAIQTVPIGFTTAITTAVLARGATVTASTSALIKGTLTLMAWTKTKTALVVTTVILLGGATTVIINHQTSTVPAPRQPPPVPARPPLPTADDGRLGGPMPDWPGMVTQAQSPEAKEQIQKIWCVDNLKQVGGAARQWAVAHDNVFPADFFALNQTISPRYLACPSDTNKTEATRWAETTTSNMSYKLISPNSRLDRPNRVIAQCPLHDHVAQSDGSVLQGKIIRERGIGPDNTVP